MPPAVPVNAPYRRRVFINCPFDAEYDPIFHAVVFTIVSCGFEPVCARTRSDSGTVRLDKIAELLGTCRYSIHDLSRVQLDARTRLPRFNMPLELGLELGLRRSADSRLKEKTCLVMDTRRYRYQVFLSDIAGLDIRAHGNSRMRAIRCVREWLRTESDGQIAGGTWLAGHFRRFLRGLPAAARRKSLTLREVKENFKDYCSAVGGYIEDCRSANRGSVATGFRPPRKRTA